MEGENPQELQGDNYIKFIGDDFIRKNVKDGTIFYKPEYSFLGDVWWWDACKVREDMLVSPNAALCKSPDYSEPYIERGYCQEGITTGHFEKIAQLHGNEFEKVRFEKVMGVKLHNDTDTCYLYHTYSGGIEFMGIEQFPQDVKNDLKEVLLRGMKELAKSGVDYHDPLPSNLRYNFNGKLICNPHNCMEVHDSELSSRQQIENLAVLLYTHRWIGDHAVFLHNYFTGALSEEEIQSFTRIIEDKIKEMDEIGDVIEIPCHWKPRWGR